MPYGIGVPPCGVAYVGVVPVSACCLLGAWRVRSPFVGYVYRGGPIFFDLRLCHGRSAARVYLSQQGWLGSQTLVCSLSPVQMYPHLAPVCTSPALSSSTRMSGHTVYVLVAFPLLVPRRYPVCCTPFLCYHQWTGFLFGRAYVCVAVYYGTYRATSDAAAPCVADGVGLWLRDLCGVGVLGPVCSSVQRGVSPSVSHAVYGVVPAL